MSFYNNVGKKIFLGNFLLERIFSLSLINPPKILKLISFLALASLINNSMPLPLYK